MADFDMIPRSYREAMRLRRSLKAFGLALGALLLLGLLAGAALRWRIGVETPLLARLRGLAEQNETARKQLEAARLRKVRIEQSLSALSALRDAGGIERVTGAIDRALSRGVWFKELRFSRDQQLLAAGQVPPQPTGYLIVLPIETAGKPSATANQTWRLSNNIEISGEAVDHAALTGFMRSLSAQPAIADVRFVNSSVRAIEGGHVLDFTVTAATRSVRGAQP
ncbi:MAG TPA: PilN domain-containing protein [Rhodocyclaceae bacterium]|nr:PilN domain-containing protein [Rhodocyclaceae bacterium]